MSFQVMVVSPGIQIYSLSMNKVHLANKQNELGHRPLHAHSRSMNLGRTVKSKAHISSSITPISPIASVALTKSVTPVTPVTLVTPVTPVTRVTPVSPILKEQKIVANQCQESSKACIRSPATECDELSFRSKAVRFEDEQTSQLALSRDKKKPVSILKKSNSIDKISVNSNNSDLGQLDFLNPKNSLKDKGLACSNDKYVKEVKDLKYENIKFFDKLFPPGGSSLCYSKQKTAELKGVRWQRIEEVFRGKKVVLYNESVHSRCICNRGGLEYGLNFATACNSLSNSTRSLQRIFEDQRVTGLCIYYLRINQDGIWKYTIVDDYIPVVNVGGRELPAFMSVAENQWGEIEIWPLLLQKAFAKIYNSYEALLDDSVGNLLFDFTGFPGEQLDLRNEEDEFKFRSSLTHGHGVAVLSEPLNPAYFDQGSYSVREESGMLSSAYFTLDAKMKVMDLRRRVNIVFEIGDLKREFGKAQVFGINESYYSLGCIVKQTKGSISVRRLRIKECRSSCMLNLIQKDKKYYNKNGYEYVWSRLMVVVKDGANGYRWVDGRYQQGRVNSLSLHLDPGEYFVLMSGDWGDRVFEMYLNYQGDQEIEFQRESLEKLPNILTEVCVDIAQRFGTLRQLNRNLCSYSVVDRRNGFLIENVNNEASRSVFYHKSYRLRGRGYELVEREKYLQEEQSAVEIKIAPDSHFTFIARLVGGFDPQLFHHFRFE